MTTTNTVQKELNIIRKALKIDSQPEWKRNAIEITAILKEHERLMEGVTVKEEVKLIDELITELISKGVLYHGKH